MRITCKQKCDRDVCELWIAECALFRFEIRLRAVAPFPSCDRVPSAEAQAARRTGREVKRVRNSIRLTSRPVLRAAYASTLGTQSQEGKGGAPRSLFPKLK